MIKLIKCTERGLTMFVKETNAIRFCKEGEWLTIRPWGKNSLRVQSVRCEDLPKENWALLDVEDAQAVVEYNETETKIGVCSLLIIPINSSSVYFVVPALNKSGLPL